MPKITSNQAIFNWQYKNQEAKRRIFLLPWLRKTLPPKGVRNAITKTVFNVYHFNNQALLGAHVHQTPRSGLYLFARVNGAATPHVFFQPHILFIQHLQQVFFSAITVRFKWQAYVSHGSAKSFNGIE